ncbi:MAG: T9SS type A sorting domain-containing protein [Flavobacteriales bacterium]|nr:T9SS type A sorting domain-containing protein [Flavobacteriales bacterium]
MISRYAHLPFLLFASVSLAQSPITLTNSDGEVVNGQTVVVYGGADEFVLGQGLTATLDVGTDRVFNVRRYELDVQPSTANYFCWGQCYAPRDAGQSVVWQGAAQDALVMVNGEPNENFHAYHMPNGIVGNSTFRYVWFDTALPTDSVWCDIQFRAIDNVGVDELTPSASLGVFPNPSRGADVQFALELRNVDQALDLVVFNALGARVRTITVRPGQLNARLGTTELAEGLYFASVLQGGKALATQRFVISGR